MDGSAGQRDLVGSRAPSRTSTTSSHSHRHHHAHCGPSNPATPQLSSFLQERIQQRRAEKKSSEGNLSTSTGNTREDNMAQSSPVRRSAGGAIRPARSTIEEDEVSVMGIKEIDKTIETLKKQNWDLKLELYHRRERQTGLEEQAKALQEEAKKLQEENENLLAEQSETMKLNDDLARELEKRDKALMEAVDFIMELQSSVAALEREKAMVRMVEADMDGAKHRDYDKGRCQAAAQISDPPKSPKLHAATTYPGGSLGDSKTLERMSSFLSERGDRAANLRDMILHNKSSFIHVRKISGVSVDPSEIIRMTSPSLSILSESSFMSVYGNNENTPDQMRFSPELEEPAISSQAERQTRSRRPSHDSIYTQNSANIPDRTTMESYRGGASLGTHVPPLDRINGMSSPLQRIEKLKGRQPAAGSSRPPSASQTRQPDFPAVERAGGLAKTKQTKRETLRSVITSSPNATDLAHARTLPPTPDTTSSSMLRRHQNSDDTLSGEPTVPVRNDVAQEAQSLPLAALPPQLSPRVAKGRFSQLAPIPVASSGRKQSRPSLNPDAFRTFSDLPRTVAQRPRSIDESTLSRHRANSWASQTDSDGGADARSEASEVDYWLRESAKPNNKRVDEGAYSPDLFNFPHDSGRWETDVIFGAMHGTGFLGSPAANLKRDPRDELGGALIAPVNGIYEPPEPESRDGGIGPPVRRSSRSARTGSMTSSSLSPEGAGTKKSLFRRNTATQSAGRPRRNSIDTAQVRPLNGTHIGYQTDGAGAAQRSQYPPPAGQPTRQRKPGGLNRLFRRSIGGSQDISSIPKSVIDSKTPDGQARYLSPRRGETPNGRSSVPPPAAMPWRAPPAIFNDERSGATPPPIMRNRVARTESSMRKGSLQEPLTPRSTNATMVVRNERAMAETEGASLVTPQGGRLKWLGLGRRSSLKSRNV